MAEVGALAPGAEVGATAQGPWAKVGNSAEYAAFFPAKRSYGFKANEFKRVNPPGGSPLDVHEVIAAAHRPVSDSPAPSGTAPINEVTEILRDNARLAAQFEKPLEFRPRSRRRLIDYLTLMVAINGFFLICIIAGRNDMLTVMFSLAGMAVFSSGVTWIMYGVMDRY